MLNRDIPPTVRDFQEIITELVRVHIQQRIPGKMLYDIKFHEVAAESFAENIVCTLEAYLQGKNYQHDEERTVMSFPISWWEHFKEAIFPMWLKNRYPVKYRQVQVPVSYKLTKVCPHLHTEKVQQHLRWMVTTGDDFDDMKKRFK